MTYVDLMAFDPTHVEGAGALLADRHRRQRAHQPLLAEKYEDLGASAKELAQLLATDGASGAVAVRGGEVVGYLLGVPKSTSWGPNMWVEAAGHATNETELIRDLYAYAGQEWFDAGLTAHFVLAPSHDPALLSAWWRLGFGQQHAHGIQPPRQISSENRRVEIRRAAASDIPDLARLDLLLPAHQARAPVFSSGGMPTLEEAVKEWEESIDDRRFANFVAVLDGDVVGSAIGCALELSSTHQSVARPENAGFLGFAAVDENARGHGVGRSLGETVIDWAASEGYDSVVTDWRVTNLLSSRTWPRLGFSETFLRLHRNIGVSG